MNLKVIKLSVLVLSFHSWAVPERPSIVRDVHMTTQIGSETGFPQYTRATIPALQTTADGRISISHKPQRDGNLVFRLQVPEKFDDPAHPNFNKAFIEHRSGSDILAHPDALVPGARRSNIIINADNTMTFNGAAINNSTLNNFYGGSSTAHQGMCDPTFDKKSTKKNPYACGVSSLNDCYDLTIIRGDNIEKVSVEDENGNIISTDSRTIFGIPVTVEVSNPKTARAQIIQVRLPERVENRPGDIIDRVKTTLNPYRGASIPMKGFLEPNVAGDGKLLFLRANAGTSVFYEDSTGKRVATRSDNVYLYNEQNSDSDASNDFAACDVQQWTSQSIRPLSHAPYDDSINKKFGFAMQLFRDTEGDVIAETQPIGTYPWIDKNADNISITSIGYDLVERSNKKNEIVDSRVTSSECFTDIDKCSTGDEAQDGGILNGRVIMGLWTRGKMVLLDNLINNIDYSLNGTDAAHRLIDLYDSGSPIRVGNGRDNDEDNHPLASSGNTTFIDSNEHRFNYFKNTMRPVTPADVSWLVSSGRGTHELAFDDYLNPNSFINANMAQVIDLRPSGLRAIVEDTVQNTATGGRLLAPVVAGRAPLISSSEWRVPRYGQLLPSRGIKPRVEPIANGGINGKGLWIKEQGQGVSFRIPEQSNERAAQFMQGTLYYGLFIDQRDKNIPGDKRLVTYSDGSSISIQMGKTLVFKDPSNNVVGTYLIDEPILRNPDNTPIDNDYGWVHLGFQVSAKASSTEVLTFVDGYPVDMLMVDQPLFRLHAGGNIIIGAGDRSETQFIGWIDDFKVFAQELNPEVACNMANGTIAGIGSEANSRWTEWSNTVDNTLHRIIDNYVNRDVNASNNIRDLTKYVCYLDNTGDLTANLGNIPADLVSVRDSINFPEGPLFFDRPRPDSSNNAFCTSCHTEDGLDGLDLEALKLRENVFAINDERRQPMQPDPFVYGVVPANWVKSFFNINNAAVGTAANPVCIDEFDLLRADEDSEFTCEPHANE
ncbi:hypothetical protein NRL14_07730 [Pseudoalteromonas sp. 20-92]|uniref:hypothetical protein n=1 Tax=Pseudoalteromonas sp. 20-92 TaxID=2969394 RepID=UPI0027B18588|nr:hypothetical protein [Pseudoalteromonas sp. 20-92]MDQ2043614.1 hypothetical protein [Pseudoalteromonas sp. 20-92]